MIKQTTTFPQFSKLPKELQLLVWEIAVAEPQTLTIKHGLKQDWWKMRRTVTESVEDVLCCRAEYKTPGFLHACHESRKAGLKLYRPAFEAQLGHPVYFNFENNLLYIKNWVAGFYFIEFTPKFGVSPNEIQSIRRLSVRLMEEVDEETLEFICSSFPGLHDLWIREPNHAFRKLPANSLPVTRTPQDAFELWDFLEKFILDEINDKYDELLDWSPPTVRIGKEEEWERAATSIAKRR